MGGRGGNAYYHEFYCEESADAVSASIGAVCYILIGFTVGDGIGVIEGGVCELGFGTL